MSFATGIFETVNRMNTNTNRVNFERGQASLGSTTLNKDAFMQLLLAKLQNQDPLNPEDNGEFLTQQAQLAQVEQMDNLNKTLQSTAALSQAGTLVGKTVDVEDGDGQMYTGKVDSASISAN